MSDKTIPVKPELLDEIKKLCEENREISLISLCTTDGFSIKSFATRELSAEADKLAAMSSTISALSESAAQQVLKGEFNVTIVESGEGNMLFVRTTYLGLPCVVTVAARVSLSLAKARFATKRMAEVIQKIEA